MDSKKGVKKDAAEDWQLAMSYCLKKGVKIVPVLIDNSTLKLVIDNNGKTKPGSIEFRTKPSIKDKKWWIVTQKLYIDIYKRLKQKENEN